MVMDGTVRRGEKNAIQRQTAARTYIPQVSLPPAQDQQVVLPITGIHEVPRVPKESNKDARTATRQSYQLVHSPVRIELSKLLPVTWI